jgi:maltose/moltooligosaccharide transporter
MQHTAALSKPRLSFWQIWNMSFGFLGIQFGFALQNGNASRILGIFGANVEHLSWFWLAAPLTGMIVQPIIGYYSDRTWTRLGRRRPYFLAGALAASVALLFMPNADLLVHTLPTLYAAAGILMIMDASFNVAMEPFRALVADLLPSDQRTLGFSIQTFLIGLGAFMGSVLPKILSYSLGYDEGLPNGQVPFYLSLSFYIGGVVFLLAILWTVITTKESRTLHHDTAEGQGHGLRQIATDFAAMPRTMRQLGLVQFFSWFALFSMWVYSTAAIATHVYGLAADDTSSVEAQRAGDWVGVCFGIYNGVSALYALLLPYLAFKLGRRNTHAVSLTAGGLGLISIYFIHDPAWLVLSMVGVGMAWASILAMPYAILGGAIPAHKMGLYMGIFNFFITLPQIVNGIIGGPVVKYLYGSQAIYALVMAGIFMLLGAVSARFIDDAEDPAHLPA